MRPIRDAWERALYGPRGFYTRQGPGAHFRTSPTASPVFAQAIAGLAAACRIDTVYDMAAGGGELAAGLAAIGPDLTVTGVDLRPRPVGLPDAVNWRPALPDRLTGLVVANEWLDNVPCPVAEVDDEGRLREVLVESATGRETLGDDVAGPDLDWARRWWPTSEPRTRVEIGRARDACWRDVVGRVDRGVAVAIDYGHVEGARPPYGSLRSYRGGRAVDVAYDGGRDITADVALDAVADAVDGRLLRQADALRSLGVSGARPDLERARSDPAGYVRALSRAGAAAELTASAGLGDFGWVVTAIGVSTPWAEGRPEA
ncbi:MAG TPA: SAM-dependent methyltransferase [Nocardioidaceae bacterium]|nr:SAM-dependent methyltransferase [Nocardioidaceae bacterium]